MQGGSGRELFASAREPLAVVSEGADIAIAPLSEGSAIAKIKGMVSANLRPPRGDCAARRDACTLVRIDVSFLFV